ncbi:hypothetical protein [Longitalea luteola]|uniref:hypothetical protein n=1 Tax=Longitalea luteola TaxID=2812563 RepID=UPI001A9622ED|nr:hypothetical protein [Longitalea luteola]
MSYDEWKYKLAMVVSSEGWQYNRNMHFADVKAALYVLADLDLDSYSLNARHLNIPYITKVLVTDSNAMNKVVVQIDSKDVGGNGVNVPGLFYTFPEGIEGFEQEAGISLASFKGYSPKNNFVLAAYMVHDANDVLLASSGVKLLREAIPAYKRASLNFQLSFSNKLFVHDGKIRSRQVSNTISQDVFYHKDIVESFYTMFNIDYNRMEEGLAWDKDLNGYCSGIHLSEIKPDGKGYKSFAAVNYQHTTYHYPKGQEDVNGVVLSVHSSYLDRIDLSPLKPVVPGFESRRLLARMNAAMTEMEPVKGLDTVLRKYMSLKERERRVNRVQSSGKQVILRTGKGRSI